jgi:hypothetical protein
MKTIYLNNGIKWTSIGSILFSDGSAIFPCLEQDKMLIINIAEIHSIV